MWNDYLDKICAAMEDIERKIAEDERRITSAESVLIMLTDPVQKDTQVAMKWRDESHKAALESCLRTLESLFGREIEEAKKDITRRK